MKFSRRMFALASLALWAASAPVWAASYDAPPEGSDVIGKVKYIKAKESDTFLKLARKYDLGYEELRNANPKVDPWLPGEGTRILLPTQYVLPDVKREGVVVNLPEMRIYYFPPRNSDDADKVYTYPAGIGRLGWSTPIMETNVSQKIPNPTWTPPESIKKEHAEAGDPLPDVVEAGPDNPMGEHALRLGSPEYLIHGTNKPSGVGMAVSHGCIRLFPEDIKELFSRVKEGTPVNIISAPFKIGWQDGQLKMEAHPVDPSDDDDEKSSVESYTPWVQVLISATRDQPDTPVNWNAAHDVAEEASGIPSAIGGKKVDEEDADDEDDEDSETDEDSSDSADEDADEDD